MEFLKLKHFQITRKEGSDAFTKKSIDLFALNIWVVIVVFKSCWGIRQRKLAEWDFWFLVSFYWILFKGWRSIKMLGKAYTNFSLSFIQVYTKNFYLITDERFTGKTVYSHYASHDRIVLDLSMIEPSSPGSIMLRLSEWKRAGSMRVDKPKLHDPTRKRTTIWVQLHICKWKNWTLGSYQSWEKANSLWLECDNRDITFTTNVPLRLTNSQIKENADKNRAKICYEWSWHENTFLASRIIDSPH